MSDYNSRKLPVVNLTVNATNGDVDKSIIALGDSVEFTPDSSGIGIVTASIENVKCSVVFDVVKSDPEITVLADDITYGEDLVVIVSADGIVAVNVTVGDETQEVALIEGMASANFTGLAVGDYTVVASFSGDDNFWNATVNATVTVTMANTTIIANDITTGYLSGEPLVATLQDAQGNAISGVEISAVVENISETLLTNENGEVSLNIRSLPMGNYIATFTFAGNENYMESTATANVMIVKEGTIITVSYDSSAKDVVVTLTSAHGLGLSLTPVYLTIEGVDYTLRTNSRGVARLSLADLAPGSYTASISYNGNSRFGSGNTTLDIEI